MLESKTSEVVVLFLFFFCLVLCSSNSSSWAICIWIFFQFLGIHQQGFGNNVLSPKFLGKWGVLAVKKSSRAAKAHVCILARTHTAKTAISTKLNRWLWKKGTNKKKKKKKKKTRTEWDGRWKNNNTFLSSRECWYETALSLSVFLQENSAL